MIDCSESLYHKVPRQSITLRGILLLMTEKTADSGRTEISGMYSCSFFAGISSAPCRNLYYEGENKEDSADYPVVIVIIRDSAGYFDYAMHQTAADAHRETRIPQIESDP